MNNIEKLRLSAKTIAKELEARKREESELVGERKSILKQLKDGWNVDDLAGATSELDGLKKVLQDTNVGLEELADEIMEELEELGLGV